MASKYVTRFIRNKSGRAQRRRILRETLPKLGDRVLTTGQAKALLKARKARSWIRARVKKDAKARAVATQPSVDASNYHSLTTWFKAQGTTVSGNDYHGKLPPTLSHGPVRFSSREGLYLGRVRYYGYKSIDELIALLNRRLKYEDARGNAIGFQEACRGWAFKWRLYGIPANGKKSVLIDKYEKKGGQAIRDLFTQTDSEGHINRFA